MRQSWSKSGVDGAPVIIQNKRFSVLLNDFEAPRSVTALTVLNRSALLCIRSWMGLISIIIMRPPRSIWNSSWIFSNTRIVSEVLASAMVESTNPRKLSYHLVNLEYSCVLWSLLNLPLKLWFSQELNSEKQPSCVC